MRPISSLTSSLTRRRFLQSSTVAAAAVAMPSVDIVVPKHGRFADHDWHALAARAIEAARAAGATYADVRISRSCIEKWSNPYPTVVADYGESHHAGVRALVNGYWGFMSSAVWTPDEMARLARGAVEQAKASGLGRTREAVLAPTPVVKGEWVMPVKYDPFTISHGEKYDFMNHFRGVAQRIRPRVTAEMNGEFERWEFAYATSDGSAWAQTKYVTHGAFNVTFSREPGLQKHIPGTAASRKLHPAGKGWELFTDSGLLEDIPAMIDQAEQARDVINVDVGRYDIVMNGNAVAAMLSHTIGAATELDRAMGFEANAAGTSYLDQPLEMLGTQVVGAKSLTVTANRSEPGAAATAKWDDEGVEPDEFTLVKDGVLVDYQTTREQVAWLAPYYQATGRPMRSHGCANGQHAGVLPIQNRPNLAIEPGKEDLDFKTLVANTKRGVAMVGPGGVIMDQQQLNGLAFGEIREIINGKLGAHIGGAAVSFRAPEFWKSLDAIGGARSVLSWGASAYKGEPRQDAHYGAMAPAARFKNVALIDYFRKA